MTTSIGFMASVLPCLPATGQPGSMQSSNQMTDVDSLELLQVRNKSLQGEDRAYSSGRRLCRTG